MQVTINVPDNLPLATVEKFVQRIERRLMRKAAIIEFKKPRPIGLVKGVFEVPAEVFITSQRIKHEIETLPLTEKAVLHLEKLPKHH